MDLKDKNVIVIGGAGGIGLETSKCFLKEGIAVLAIFDLKMIDDKELEDLKNSYPKATITWTHFDITDKKAIEENFTKFVEKYKFLDILVNGAGILSDRQVELTISVNFVGVMNTSLQAISLMDKSQHGRGGLIVNIASVLGLEVLPPLAIYTASKHGVVGFTRAMADDLYYNKTGVKLIAICPGITETLLIDYIDNRTYFPYAAPMAKQFLDIQSQSAAECAKNLTKAIKMGKNGSVWICDLGNLEEVDFKTYWEGKPRV